MLIREDTIIRASENSFKHHSWYSFCCKFSCDGGVEAADQKLLNMEKSALTFDREELTASPEEPGHRDFFSRLPRIPLFFLGLGVYRAWIEIVFVGSFVDFPTKLYAGHNTFDIAMIATMLVCAIAAKKIGPFFRRRSIYITSGVALCLSTLAVFGSLLFPELASILALPSAIIGGIGIAFLILYWSELYSCLNPLRVALYYSASIVAAALILYMCRGLLSPWLLVVAMLLPVISLLCVSTGFRSLPDEEKPRNIPGKFSFPWKPVLVMAIYAFAYGMKEPSLYLSQFGPHSAPGAVVVAVIVFVGVALRGGRFKFGMIYRIALPLMIAAFLVLPSLGVLNQWFSGFCMAASYTAFSILIMLILASMSYRYGISAVWLFGLERGVRSLFNLFGRQVESHVGMLNFGVISSEILINALVILLVVVVTMIFFSEKELSSRWGVSFIGGTDEVDKVMLRKQELLNRCTQISSNHGLSQREEEVLVLLAQHKTIGVIERELFIANGTAKTHIRHIYRKLNIHSRNELYDMVDIHN
jgi:DNA-binding CsgD family transcriptional regulator